MKGKLFAIALILGVGGPAAAQDPVVNIGNTVGNLLINVNTTVSALQAVDANATVVALNTTVGDLHQDLSAGTPLETNNRLGDTLTTASTIGTGAIDGFLAGELTVEQLMGMSRALGIQRTLESGDLFGAGSPVTIILALGGSYLSNDGTILSPDVALPLLDSLAPFNNLPPSLLLGALMGGGTGDGLPLDPAMLTGLLGGSGDAAFDLGVLTGLLAGDSPAGALDPAMLTALLGGSGDAAFDLGLLTGLLAGSGGDAGLPFDLGLLTGLLAGSGGAGGLPIGDLPLSLDALDPSTLTALLGGDTLPGL